MTVQIPARTASTAAPGALSVFADLGVKTNGHNAHLVGDDQSLVLHSSHPLKPGCTASIGVIRRGDMGRMASHLGKW